MSDENGDGHKTAVMQPPTGRPFAPGFDPRRNAGCRPRGLAALVRQAVGDGEDIVNFYVAVLFGDKKFLGERRVTRTHRLMAGEWLASRGWGKAVTVVAMPDEPVEHCTPEQTATLREMPPELKDAIRRWLNQRREKYLAREREAAERRMLSFMPSTGTDGNGDGSL